MNPENSITGYAIIKNGKLISNGSLIFQKKGADANEFFNSAYTDLKTSYHKFFKMDNLCKTGFLAVETLLQHKKLSEKYKAEEIGILFSNANSSLDTDLRYHESSQRVESPALFVYTLPNVLIGELCIRHGIKGETACFVFDIFDPEFQTRYLNSLIDSGRIKAGISGWADFYDGEFEGFFYLVEKTEGNQFGKHNSINVTKLYNSL